MGLNEGGWRLHWSGAILNSVLSRRKLRRRVEADQNHLPPQLAGTVQSASPTAHRGAQPAAEGPRRRKEAAEEVVQEDCAHPWVPQRLTAVGTATGFPAASGNPDPERRLCPNLPSAPEPRCSSCSGAQGTGVCAWQGPEATVASWEP